MLRICNWIAGLFGYRLMSIQTFTCPVTWTMPQNFKTIRVEMGSGGAGEGGNA